MGHSSSRLHHPMLFVGWCLVVGCALVGSEVWSGAATSAAKAEGPTASRDAALAASTSAERGDVSTRPDSLRPTHLVQPEELARLLAAPAASRPRILQIGFRTLYGTGHIAGSQYVGAASDPKGLRALKVALRSLPRRQPLVLYCGCCPWNDCPNVRPAFHAARRMGFQNVRVLFISKNLGPDWIDKGFPTERK